MAKDVTTVRVQQPAWPDQRTATWVQMQDGAWETLHLKIDSQINIESRQNPLIYSEPDP